MLTRKLASLCLAVQGRSDPTSQRFTFFFSLPVSFLCGSTRKITAVLGLCVLIILIRHRKSGGLGTWHQREAVTVWTEQVEGGVKGRKEEDTWGGQENSLMGFSQIKLNVMRASPCQSPQEDKEWAPPGREVKTKASVGCIPTENRPISSPGLRGADPWPCQPHASQPCTPYPPATLVLLSPETHPTTVPPPSLCLCSFNIFTHCLLLPARASALTGIGGAFSWTLCLRGGPAPHSLPAPPQSSALLCFLHSTAMVWKHIYSSAHLHLG